MRVLAARGLGEAPQATVKCLARMVSPWSLDSVILHRTSVGKKPVNTLMFVLYMDPGLLQ